MHMVSKFGVMLFIMLTEFNIYITLAFQLNYSLQESSWRYIAGFLVSQVPIEQRWTCYCDAAWSPTAANTFTIPIILIFIITIIILVVVVLAAVMSL